MNISTHKEMAKTNIGLLMGSINFCRGGHPLSRCAGGQPALKIILMSGYSSETAGKDLDSLQKAGLQFLQKPCSLRTVIEAVRNCLDGA
ncbi:MAG TPA: hypothetical protein VEC99_00450 [Clostridia bacterium]|nr:hypothetical protein [Clostridia bacterium]